MKSIENYGSLGVQVTDILVFLKPDYGSFPTRQIKNVQTAEKCGLELV